MWLFSFIANLAGWTIFSFSDYLEETGNDGSFMAVVAWGIPALVGIAYIVRNMLERRERAYTIKECLKNAGKWFLVSGMFGVVINALLINEWWFIKQATGGWENFLNGIEYALFALFLTGGVLGVIVLWNILYWIYWKIRNLHRD